MRADAMLSSEGVLALKDILNIRSGGCQLRNHPRLITLVPIPAENFPARPVRCKQVHSPQSHPLPSHPCCSPFSSALEDEDGWNGNKARTKHPGSTFPVVPASARLPGGFLYKQPLREEFWRQWEPSPGSCRLLNH